MTTIHLKDTEEIVVYNKHETVATDLFYLNGASPTHDVWNVIQTI